MVARCVGLEIAWPACHRHIPHELGVLLVLLNSHTASTSGGGGGGPFGILLSGVHVVIPINLVIATGSGVLDRKDLGETNDFITQVSVA